MRNKDHIVNRYEKYTTFDSRFPERSKAAQEEISRKPNFFENWILIIFILILISGITCSYFIKYSETIEKAVTTIFIKSQNGSALKNDSALVAEVIFSKKEANLISSGVRAQLYFETFPYNTFGRFQGNLLSMSKMPNDDSFVGTFNFFNKLPLNKSRNIPFPNGIQARIVVDGHIRLLKKLYEKVIPGKQGANTH